MSVSVDKPSRSSKLAKRQTRPRSPSRVQDNGDDDDWERKRLLALLEAHGKSTFGDSTVGKGRRDGRGKGKAKSTDLDEADEEEEGSWRGVGSETEAESGADDGDEGDLDDGQDLFASAQAAQKSKPAVTVFSDPSRAGRALEGVAGRKAFMASSVKGQLANGVDGESKQRGRDDDEEAQLASLDKTLASLISTYNAPSSSSKLQSLLSTSLAPPPSTSSANPQNHGRRLKHDLAAASLKRARREDEEAKRSGTVRHKGAGASTLRESRREKGEDERRRKQRKGLASGGGAGKGGGGMIRLSEDQLRTMRRGAR